MVALEDDHAALAGTARGQAFLQVPGELFSLIRFRFQASHDGHGLPVAARVHLDGQLGRLAAQVLADADLLRQPACRADPRDQAASNGVSFSARDSLSRRYCFRIVTSLTPVRRAIWACVYGTPSSSEARYRAPAAIPTGEFASRTFESFTWATRAKDRSPTRGSRPSWDANRGTKSSARLARLNTPSSRLTTFAVSEIRWTVTPVASDSSCRPRGAPSCFAAR